MDPDPTPDPTRFFSDFKDATKKFCLTVKFYFASIISVRSTLYEKREGSGSGRLKNMRIRIPNIG
jgi:hypothetical protein